MPRPTVSPLPPARAGDFGSGDLCAGAIDLVLEDQTVRLTPSGAACLPARGALVVADLHFEKGSAFARRGVLLPPYDTRTTLMRLQRLIETLRPEWVISLGDAFHDGEAEGRMDAADAALLESLTSMVRWTWILGNHDPAPPARFAGDAVTELRVGSLTLRHEPSDGVATSAGELAGHLHPCARVRAGAFTAGRTVRRRCFATDGRRMILPAFGAYTGGLNVLDKAYGGMFGDLSAYVLGARGVYPFPRKALAPDDAGAARRAG